MPLEQNVNPKIVQRLLAHRDISTTLGVYTHVVPEIYRGVTAIVNEVSRQFSTCTYKPRASVDLVKEQLVAMDQSLLNEQLRFPN